MITDTNSLDHQKFMYQGLYLDALRGMDSTGLMTIDSLGDMEINKKAMAAPDFLGLKSVDEQIADFSNRVFIGHNRAATRGAVNNVNAHPFTHGDITMVHNGSLRNFDKLPDAKYFTVDSDAIAHSIHKIGIEETLKLLQGAYALVWWDESTKMVNMVRNSERPLNLAVIEGKNTVIWGSEANMLHYVAGRSGFKIKDTWELPINTIATFDPAAKDIWDCTVLDAPFYTAPSYGGTGDYDQNGFPHYGANSTKHGKLNKGTTKEREEEAAKRKARTEEDEKRFKARDALSARMMNTANMKRGDIVNFVLWDFTPYSEASPECGVWQGSSMEEPFVSVVIYGERQDSYKLNDEYSGKALNFSRIDPKSSSETLINMKLAILGSSIKHEEEDKTVKSTIILAEEAGIKISPNKTLILPDDKGRPLTLSEATAANLRGIDIEGKTPSAVRRLLLSTKKSTLTISGKVTQSVANKGTDDDFYYITGPRNTNISVREWVELTKHGCGHCSQDISSHESQFVEWVGDNNTPICPTCVAKQYNSRKDLH